MCQTRSLHCSFALEREPVDAAELRQTLTSTEVRDANDAKVELSKQARDLQMQNQNRDFFFCGKAFRGIGSIWRYADLFWLATTMRDSEFKQKNIIPKPLGSFPEKGH